MLDIVKLFKYSLLLMPMGSVLFGADFHGNHTHYQGAVAVALHGRVDALLIGGDLAPKSERGHLDIDEQARFLSNDLPLLLQPLENRIPVYLIMGNDDCKTNLHMLQGKWWHEIHSRRLALSDDLDVVGYSRVPITPFCNKDWEAFDLTNDTGWEQAYPSRQQTYRLSGYISTARGWKECQISPEAWINDSIQADLNTEVFQKHPHKTIYLMHGPAVGVHDVATVGRVGSFALRDFIYHAKPRVVLSGHIHETVWLTGSYRQFENNTVCLTPGNDWTKPHTHLILIDPQQPKKAQRITL